MINMLLHSRGSNSNRSFGPADVRTHLCGLPQTSAPIHADVSRCPHPSMRTSATQTSAKMSADLSADVHMEILGMSAQKKFPACVDLRTYSSNTLQTYTGKCPQFSMRNITFQVRDLSCLTGIFVGSRYPQ